MCLYVFLVQTPPAPEKFGATCGKTTGPFGCGWLWHNPVRDWICVGRYAAEALAAAKCLLSIPAANGIPAECDPRHKNTMKHVNIGVSI